MLDIMLAWRPSDTCYPQANEARALKTFANAGIVKTWPPRTAIAPLAPGSPLCRAHAVDPARDGLQIALKGGQVGGEDFFRTVRDGAPR